LVRNKGRADIDVSVSGSLSDVLISNDVQVEILLLNGAINIGVIQVKSVVVSNNQVGKGFAELRIDLNSQ